MLLGYYVRNGKGRKQCFFYFNCIFLESRGRGRESEMRDKSRSSQLLVYFPNVYNSWDATRPMWEPPTPSAEEQGSNHLNYHRHSSTEHWNLKKKSQDFPKWHVGITSNVLAILTNTCHNVDFFLHSECIRV